MRILKYVILSLILLNLSSFFFFNVSQVVSSLMSYGTYVLLMAYFVLRKGGKPNLWVLITGISFFMIAGLNFHSGKESEYYGSLIKFVITIVFGGALVKDITVKEMYTFLFIGALSPIVHAVAYPDNYGRYSGFYINANTAGFIAAIAFTLTFQIKKVLFRNLGQILITIGGLVTFSRTFILMWLLTNLISLKISIKNIKIIGVGFGLLVLLVIFGELFSLNTVRLKTITNLLDNKEGAVEDAGEASRTETWALYYDYILDKPLQGNGYNSFQASGFHSVSVHNAFLLIIGEAGIVPFLLFVGFCIYILYKGVLLFKLAPYILMQSVSFVMFMLTFHNFFQMEWVLLITLWIFQQIKEKSIVLQNQVLISETSTQ